MSGNELSAAAKVALFVLASLGQFRSGNAALVEELVSLGLVEVRGARISITPDGRERAEIIARERAQ